MKTKSLYILFVIGFILSPTVFADIAVDEAGSVKSEWPVLTKAEKDAIAVKDQEILAQADSQREAKLAEYEQKRQELVVKNQQEIEKYQQWRAQKSEKDALIGK